MVLELQGQAHSGATPEDLQMQAIKMDNLMCIIHQLRGLMEDIVSQQMDHKVNMCAPGLPLWLTQHRRPTCSSVCLACWQHATFSFFFTGIKRLSWSQLCHNQMHWRICCSSVPAEVLALLGARTSSGRYDEHNLWCNK